jgi:S-adenosylmethionine-dependent methyltransferase
VADPSLRSRPWTHRTDPRAALRTVAVWEILDARITQRTVETGRSSLDVVDVGGGTGGFAVPLAELGHRVTVFDPSPDALAALQRRAAEAGVADRIVARQADAGELVHELGPACADLVLCHGVLEYVEDPRSAVEDAVAVLRPGGLASLLVAQRLGAVLARALSGRFCEAKNLLDSPRGTAGAHDQVQHRFDEESLRALLNGHPVRVLAVHGVRLVTDLLPGVLLDGDPEVTRALLELERRVSDNTCPPALTAVASQLHLLAEVTGTVG